MSIAPELVGAWRRTGLIIGGRRQLDFCDVLWLQSPDWYADIRLRIGDLGPDETDPIAVHYARARAFAGRASWAPPVLTWAHEIDDVLDPPPDANEISWERGGIIERGTRMRDGQPVPWAEEWLRISTPDAPVTTESDGPQQLRISVEDWAVEIRDDRPSGNFVATRSDRIDGEWQVIGQVTAGPS